MTAKILTSAIAGFAMLASLTLATPADALNQRERNIVGGIAIGVLSTLAVQSARKAHRAQPRQYQTRAHQPRICHNPTQVWHQGRIVTVCR